MVGERKGTGGEGMGVDLIKNVLYACMKCSSTKEESKEEKPVSVSVRVKAKIALAQLWLRILLS